MSTSSSGRDEVATRVELIDPALHRVGWAESQINREFWVGDGQIVDTGGGRCYRASRLRADYVLEHEPGFPIAVVEAKPEGDPAEKGVEQAKRYARGLALPVAYATNGHVILEIDMTTGSETFVERYPSPEELWQRFVDVKGLGDDLAMQFRRTPFRQNLLNFDGTIKRPRYYQKAAVDEILGAIARRQKKILVTLATGTGKTFLAYLLAGKLADCQWPTGAHKPRVLYLADRNILIDDPKDNYFVRGFGEDAVWKLGQGNAVMSRYFYFALYQSLDQTGDEGALFKQFGEDFFDLIIVDECHRGSSAEDSRWREILEHFDSAVQLGMTATPVEDDERSTVGYFGEPVYMYTLGDGIRDGYLAPYRVNKILLNVDVAGWRPSPGQLDMYRREIPDKVYGPKEFERIVAILERTQEAARALMDYLERTDPMAKTVVFCQDIEHAGRMRAALANLAADASLAGPRNDYVFRITADDGDAGMAQLDIFRKTETERPVVAVTSKLLSTGVDMPTVRNVVFLRAVKSVPEFKQIIGRGTRLCEEEDKLVFTIVDFCDATKHFSRPDFDGLPLGRPMRTRTDAQGHLWDEEADPDATGTEKTRQEQGFLAPPPPHPDDLTPGVDAAGVVRDPDLNARIRQSPAKYFVDGVEVFVFNESFYTLRAESQELVLTEYRQYVGEQVRRMELTPTNLRGQWARAVTRRKLAEAFRAAGIDEEEVYKHTGHEDVDVIDLLLNLAYGTALVTRSERVKRVRAEHKEFLASFAAEAQEILEILLDRYELDGIEEVSADALRTIRLPAGDSSVRSLVARFGGSSGLHEAIDGLAARLYDLAA